MSYEQLIAISQEARELREQEAREAPTACPVHGVPLLYNARRGILFCPDGDFQTTGGPRETR